MKRTFSNGSNKCFLPSAAMVWRNSSPEKSLFHQLRCVIVKVNWLKMKPMNGTFSKTVLLPHGCFYCKSHLLSQLVGSDTSKDIWSTLLRLFSTMSTTKICDTLAASAASREPVSLEGVCSILVDAERRNLILQDLVVDHTQNANFVERWDILLIDASIGLVILYRVSPRAVIDHHDQCLQLICVLSHQLFQFFWTMFCPLMVHQLQCLLIVQF
ncbi:uncharacterized protein [Gossypium hirsutum]|uniref:Uncharacterized protein isoform X2 n=1 Tax=Gossypium hirsutum TaxID=3635 RepID=A0ABM3BU73_GOSHI|nr:uncharacterized protein LOC121230213 isoform X2 [Gossypium hirsutum]